jgi:putative transposase
MSRKMTKYSTELKTKLVLAVLSGDKTLNEIAVANNILPKNLQNWKKLFLENAEMAMEPSKLIKEYKIENSQLNLRIDEYAKVVGKMTVENEWLTGKLKSLDLSNKKEMIESKLKIISVKKQCELLGLNRSNLYYKPAVNQKKENIKDAILRIHQAIPF